jgi:hypothetical protein
VSWKCRESRLANAHLPYELGLRDRRLSILPSVAGSRDAMLSGDIYAAPDNVFLNDFLFGTQVRTAGTDLHPRRRA